MEIGRDNIEEVTISSFEYDQLQQDQVWLSCLEKAGLPDWEGFEEASLLFEDYINEHCRIH